MNKIKETRPRKVLLKRFEIMDKKDKLSTELSKGMQQKVSICCGLLHRPEIVIFDEPMVGYRSICN